MDDALSRKVRVSGSSIFVDEPLYAARILLDSLLRHLGGIDAAAKAISASWKDIAAFALLQPRYKSQVMHYWRQSHLRTGSRGGGGTKAVTAAAGGEGDGEGDGEGGADVREDNGAGADVDPVVDADSDPVLELPSHHRARRIQSLFPKLLAAVSRRCGGGGGVMLLVDDAQWVDASSWRILEVIVESSSCRDFTAGSSMYSFIRSKLRLLTEVHTYSTHTRWWFFSV